MSERRQKLGEKSCPRCGVNFNVAHKEQIFCSRMCACFGKRQPPLSARIAKKIRLEKNRGCWLWCGATDRLGYGVMRIAGKLKKAHRISYEIHRGDIPPGLCLDHLCRVRNCVNPEHLEPVTPGENTRRGDAWKYNGLKTHCKHGHEFNDKNTYFRPTGGRTCRVCRGDFGRGVAA